MEKLKKIQTKIKVGKGRWNDYSKFWYRSCEDICKAIRQTETKENCLFLMRDEICEKAGHPTMKATVTYIDLDNGERVEGSAEVIVEPKRKGMTSEQASGAASSYARKIALAGLLLLDDEQDPDTDGTTKSEQANDAWEQAIAEAQTQERVKDLMKQAYNADQYLWNRLVPSAEKRLNQLTQK